MFDNGPLEERFPTSEALTTSQPALSLLPGSPDVPSMAEEDDPDWKERHSSHNEGSVDSMEEMARRFEKVGDIKTKYSIHFTLPPSSLCPLSPRIDC